MSLECTRPWAGNPGLWAAQPSDVASRVFGATPPGVFFTHHVTWEAAQDPLRYKGGLNTWGEHKLYMAPSCPPLTKGKGGHEKGGRVGTRHWWLALLACGGAY